MATDAEQACLELARLLPGVVTPEVAAGYKRWVIDLASAVADAAKEHGQWVSAGELAVMERVRLGLGQAG